MTALLEKIRDTINGGCLVTSRLKKDGCKIVTKGLPEPRLIIDFDKRGSPLPPNVTRCDYLLVAEVENTPPLVAVLELKRGKLHADQIVRQLRAGASAAEKLVPQNQAVRFRPIAASGSAPKHERTKLRDKANRIKLHEQNERVRLMSCGARLAATLR